MEEKSAICIIFPFSFLESTPNITNIIEACRSEGIPVDVYTYLDPNYAKPEFGSGVNCFFYNKSEKNLKIFLDWVNDLKFWSSDFHFPGWRFLQRTLLGISSGLDNFFLDLLFFLQVRKCPYSHIIGVDAKGVILASKFATKLNVPLIYDNIELMLSYDWSIQFQEIKKKEIEASHQAKYVIIQDPKRATALSQDNKISLNKFIYIQSGPIGPINPKKTNYWREKYALPDNVKIVLHFGNMYWKGLEEIIDSVSQWPDSWIFITHGWHGDESKSRIDDLSKFAVPDRVFFSANPVSRDEIQEMVNGADIGIALYFPTNLKDDWNNTNIKELGLSSGKIGYYLKGGLPVIVNNGPSIAKIIQESQSGEVISDIHEIPSAILKIHQQYQNYTQNAFKLFEKIYDPLPGIQKLVNILHNDK